MNQVATTRLRLYFTDDKTIVLDGMVSLSDDNLIHYNFEQLTQFFDLLEKYRKVELIKNNTLTDTYQVSKKPISDIR